MFLGTAQSTAPGPRLRRNSVGAGQVELEELFHFTRKLGAEHDDIHLIVMQKTAPINVDEPMVDHTPSITVVFACNKVSLRS